LSQQSEELGWFDWNPVVRSTDHRSEIDFRFLNEAFAGENGHVIAKNGQFFQAEINKPVRFGL